MPHIRITPLPSVNIQPNSYGNFKKKKQLQITSFVKTLIVIYDWLSVEYTRLIYNVLLLLVLMHVNTRINCFLCLLAFVISWIPGHCSGLSIRFKKIFTSSHLETSGSLLFKMNLKIYMYSYLYTPFL